jgi:uncharacterized protein YbjT (DUF2867 family)
MRVLVLGASGLIGSAVLARLVAEGHQITAAMRRHQGTSPFSASVTELAIDIARAVHPADWVPYLHGLDAVVNCAGVLQDSTRDSTSGVHIHGAAALFAACEQVGVRRVVHLSAVGVDRPSSTAFSRTKLAGDQALMARDLDWVILRPSVVIGRPAYGGSALIRALAALPMMPVIPGTGRLQVVLLDDVVDAVLFFLLPAAPRRVSLELVGPREWELGDLLRLFRRWLRLPPARALRVPHWASAAMFRLGDVISLLGWRPPIRTTAWIEIARGAVGDANAWIRLTGIQPRDLEAALAAEPASVQERWFARLYLLKPVVFALLSLFWVGSGAVSLGPGFEMGRDLLQEAGAGELAGPGVIAGSVADIAIGLGMLVRPLARVALLAALTLSLFYAIAGTVLLPELWADPLGPLMKIAPLLALNLAALAILDER